MACRVPGVEIDRVTNYAAEKPRHVVILRSVFECTFSKVLYVACTILPLLYTILMHLYSLAFSLITSPVLSFYAPPYTHSLSPSDRARSTSLMSYHQMVDLNLLLESDTVWRR